MFLFSILLYSFFVTCVIAYEQRKPAKFHSHKLSAKYSNPSYIRDRLKDEIYSPLMPELVVDDEIFKPTWMDYCNPQNCDSYNRQICGVRTGKGSYQKYRWFQSGCHLELNNFCAKERGNSKYEKVAESKCHMFTIARNSDCPKSCNGQLDPVCARSNLSGAIVVFKNHCLLNKTNCDPAKLPDEFEEMNSIECAKQLIAYIIENK